ncbi:glycosyltransferase [Nostocales cyanobacterium LEGE 11386]|nr:glycosyltransferase [Nostocales cyanobacterium LEGE 11386]
MTTTDIDPLRPLDHIFTNGDSAIAQNSLPTYALISVHGDPTAKIGQAGVGRQNVYVRELGLALAQRGCQVDMFTRREDPDQAEIVVHSPGCRTIRLTAGPAKFIPRTELFAHLPAFVAAWLEFQRQSGRNYTLLHTNYWLSGWVGLQLKSQLGLPQIHTYHSLGAVKYRGLENPPEIAALRQAVEWACLEQTDCVVSTSPQEVADLREFISLQGRIKVIPYGIDITYFGSLKQKNARQKLGIAANSRMILYVGSFDKGQGIETLVKACAHVLQPFQLYLVGGSLQNQASPEQQHIQALVKKLSLAAVTVFTGQVPQNDLPAYYAAADVCVIPSYYEPLGLVALEAMAAGTPVIASDVGGLRHTVVNGETGILVAPGNSNAFAIAIQDVFADLPKWQSYGVAARNWVQSRFSCAAVAAQIHELYQSLTLKDSVAEIIKTKKLTPVLEKQIQNLLTLKALRQTEEVLLLEQLIESLFSGAVERVG